jgi:hypothetical protein
VTRRGLHVYPVQVSEIRDAGLAADVADATALDAAEQHLSFVVHGRIIDRAEACLNRVLFEDHRPAYVGPENVSAITCP